jgi:acyl-CoA synthetase (AMP-forming)/AMP-acid ligase II
MTGRATALGRTFIARYRPGVTDLRTLIREVPRLEPDRPAIEYEGHWHIWRELDDLMTSLDRLLAAAGLGEGAPIGVVTRNQPAVAATILGVVTSGRTMVVLDGLQPPDKLIADIRALGVAAIVAPSLIWERPEISAVATELGALGVELVNQPELAARLRPDLSEVRRNPGHEFRPGVAVLMQSSGTTGKPKRVPLSYSALERGTLDAMVYDRNRRPDDPPRLRSGTEVFVNPLGHIGGINVLAIHLSSGRKLCLLEKFSVAEWAAAVRRHQPRAANLPPAALRMLIEADVPPEDLASLVALRTGTAPLDPQLAAAFTARYGVPVLQNYGATEYAGGVAGWTLGDFRAHATEKVGSVGRVHAEIEARTVDEASGAPLPVGATGVLELRGRQLGDGVSWMRTTDLAVVDADRFLWIKGRADNVIIRGGFKVFPEPVVDVLHSHPDIREACVLGLPDERLGAVPVAAVIPAAGASHWPTEEELRTYCRERLTGYQVPARILVLPEFPRTFSMKPSQPQLRELFLAGGPA